MNDARHRGALVEGFTPPPAPGPAVIEGRFMRLERLDAVRHATELHRANGGADEVWDYMGYGAFDTLDAYRDWQTTMAQLSDPFFYAIRDAASGKVAGLAAYLRIEPAHGVIEIGHIQLSPALQRTAAASEALMAMIRWAFETGYRRVEWKCDALNAPSRRAALRLGFVFEGVFRKHMVVKGRNRDTAWFAITDTEWPALRTAYDRWLSPDNFDGASRQRESLSALTKGDGR
ncbi:GNAT family N-acetyltransferase [Paracoccus sp. TK19116]|uniref:GNAT family N-acetyltransferase n=1 Tax=Paracoccus albicereus TaxID=2922394 RepID=A0ABT1MS88_9RHOB|nr:GNAT family protein [Paracoccus albicereus]MCQ0971180.1 GNAT family N-acetyltransferase [Paracoccus albicereus]